MDVVFWNGDPFDVRIASRYIGPYKLAHWINKNDYTTQVIDFIARLTEEQLYRLTTKFITQKTLLLGISTTFLCSTEYKHSNGMTSRFPEHVCNVARRIKEEFPNIKIVLGGYKADHLYMYGIPHAVIMSYTTAVEDVFLEYINHLKFKTPPPLGKLAPGYNGIDDIKNLKPRMIYDTAREPKYNIEHDDFRWTDRDGIIDNEALPLDVSRGCIFACRFCQYPHLGKKKLDYIRGMEYIREEMLYNYEHFKTTNYLVLDDTFNDTLFKMEAFKNMTDGLPFKITYTAYLRADLIHRFDDMAYLLKESGLLGAVHGIESMHPYASNLVGKAWSGKQAREYIPKLYHDLWKAEVAQQLNFIIGLPKETEADIRGTIDWFKANKLHNMYFNALGVISPNAKNKLYTVTSEFDRNSEKYGFYFDQDNKWFNETWTHAQANALTNEIKQTLYRDRTTKIVSWNIGPMMALGYHREELLRTPVKDFNNATLTSLTGNWINQYIQRIESLDDL